VPSLIAGKCSTLVSLLTWCDWSIVHTVCYVLGLDKLASQKRKEADANEVESKKSRSGGKSDKSSR